MTTFEENFNIFLVDSFNTILKLEEGIIRSSTDIPLTISELHLMEAIANTKENNTISGIATHLDITMSSVTIGVNKLIGKGFAQKEKSQRDGRSVHITLTPIGEKMDERHKSFHAKMIRQISAELSEQEKEVLAVAIEKLSIFFNKSEEKE